jgi:predicted nucleic acid-binding protein
LIVVDTTILAYAVGSEHSLREPSRRVLAAAASGAVVASTSVYVIQEFAHIRSRRFPRREAAELARRYADLLSPLLVAETDQLRRALALFERHASLGSFDALLAACALEHEADALVSADRRFASVPGLNHVFPGTRELERLLAP